MIEKIFNEWFNWFRKEVNNKRCVFLIDDFSVYKTDLKTRETKENGFFQNIKIFFLSANVINVYQSFNQGIIAVWKIWYRHRWLKYVVTKLDAKRISIKTMNILKIIKWGVKIWKLNIIVITITNCWIKSIILIFNMNS